jgi:hypothetical protein
VLEKISRNSKVWRRRFSSVTINVGSSLLAQPAGTRAFHYEDLVGSY